MQFTTDRLFEPAGLAILVLLLAPVFYFILYFQQPEPDRAGKMPQEPLKTPVPALEDEQVAPIPQLPAEPVVTTASHTQPDKTKVSSPPSRAVRLSRKDSRPAVRRAPEPDARPVPRPAREIGNGKSIPDFRDYGRPSAEAD